MINWRYVIEFLFIVVVIAVVFFYIVPMLVSATSTFKVILGLFIVGVTVGGVALYIDNLRKNN